MRADAPQTTFSVIIPTHNRERLLGRAIRSVLRQTFADYELLVVDDASGSATREVVQSFRDERIVYIRRETNGGAAATRNTGILRANGKYVAFLDDDDEYLPNFLQEMGRAFSEAPEQVGWAWCGTRIVEDAPAGEVLKEEGVWRPSFRDREHAYLSFLCSRRIGTNCGITIRRSCFESVGLFDETLKKAEDTEMFIRLARHFDFTVVPAILVKVHHHAGARLTVYDRRMAEAYERIIEKNQEALRQQAGLGALLHYKAGWLYYHGGDRARGRKHILEALRKNPFHLKSLTGLVFFETLGPLGPVLHKQISVGLRK